jgi:hypothetical protein
LMRDVTRAQSNLNKKRLVAGLRLRELRARIEAGEVGDVSWWAFYDQHLAQVRSRTDAEKLMRMAGADDPEAALEVERTEAKERMRKHRAVAAKDGANVRSNGLSQPDIEDAEYEDVPKPRPKRRASTRVKAFTEGFLNTVWSVGIAAETYRTDEALDLLTKDQRAVAIETIEAAIGSLQKVGDRLRGKDREAA